jgi:hypothetical protein
VAVLRADHPCAGDERADLVTLTAGILIAPSRTVAPGLHAQLAAEWAVAGGNPDHARPATATA